MDRLGLWSSTIVAFTSDHGMSLGEKGMWEKNTLWEVFFARAVSFDSDCLSLTTHYSPQETSRVPLIIADPRYPAHHGKHFLKPVEILNLPETIYDLVGIDHVFNPEFPHSPFTLHDIM